MVGAWSDGVLDPRSWGFGSEPVHEYVVRSRASRLRTLRRIIAGLPDAVSAMRPAIWPAHYGDEHTGIRRLEARWEHAGSSDSSSSPYCTSPTSRVPLASEGHQTPPQTLPGCIALVLAPLRLETDAQQQLPSTSSASGAYAETARACRLTQR